MNWTTKGVAALATGTMLFCGVGTVTAVALTGHHGSAPAATAAPAKTASPIPPAAPKAVVPRTTPAPTKIIYVPVPAGAPSSIVNAEAVVTQYYQDITDHNYPAAWAMGGSNVSGGVGYDAWVAGYATTASITLYNSSNWGSGEVVTYLSAVQSDGSTRTYYGTYYVSKGVITSASIAQTS